MTTKTTAVEQDEVQATVPTVAEAQTTFEMAEEKLAALKLERTELITRQGQLTGRDAEEFFSVQPRFDAQREKVNEQQRLLNEIGMQMRPSQMLLGTVSADRGMLNVQLGNLRAQWAQRMNADNAPVVRSLQHRPRVTA